MSSLRQSALKCPSCGAPLRWAGDARVVECRYCGTRVLVETGQLAPEGQRADARSEEVPELDERAESRAASTASQAVVAVLAITLSVVGALGAWLASGSSGYPRVDYAVLRALSPKSSRAELLARLGVETVENDQLWLNLRGGPAGQAFLQWDDTGERLESLSLLTRSGFPNASELPGRFQAALGPRFARADARNWTWRWGGTHLSLLSDERGNWNQLVLGVEPDEERDAGWQDRFALLWYAAFAVLDGRELGLAPAQLQGWLGQGFPLSSLRSFSPSLDLDRALAEVPSRFPGAVLSRISGVELDVPLASADFSAVELEWPNRAGGWFESARFDPPAGQDRFPDTLRLHGCLVRAFGASEDSELDHIQRRWSYRWRLPSGSALRLRDTNLIYDPEGVLYGHRDHPGPAKRALEREWRSLVTALERCR